MIRCEETLRKLIQQMRGQYFIYHNCETSNLPSWKIRWKSEYLPDKKFYVIGSGNDGD